MPQGLSPESKRYLNTVTGTYYGGRTLGSALKSAGEAPPELIGEMLTTMLKMVETIEQIAQDLVEDSNAVKAYKALRDLLEAQTRD